MIWSLKLILLQANSITSSDKIINGKRNKSEEYTEHKNILEQALAKNPCDERREATTGKAGFFFRIQPTFSFEFRFHFLARYYSQLSIFTFGNHT